MIIRDVCLHYDVRFSDCIHYNVRFSDWHVSMTSIWFTLDDEVHNDLVAKRTCH